MEMTSLRKFFSITVLGLISVSLLWFGFYQPFIKSRAQTTITPPLKEDKPPHELAFESTTAVDAAGRQVVVNYNSIMVLVNKVRNLPSDYVPADLTVPNVPFPFKEDDPRKNLRAEAALALEKLFAEATKSGFDLFATSGYRSYAKQASLFNSRVQKVGEEEANKTVARPGQSEHQTGLAMDVTSPRVKYDLVESFGTTPEGMWLKDNCHRFGFIIRYPLGKEHITGYSYEPWHLRYVGFDVAEYIYTNGITLEEYFQQVYNY